MRLLGTCDDESGAHALAAASALGISVVGADLALDDLQPPPLGTLGQALTTVAAVSDLGLLVRLGKPTQPSTSLETALVEQDPGVSVVNAVRVPRQWVWVARRGSAVGAAVVLDERAFVDCGAALVSAGLSARVVPNQATMKQRLETAATDASMIIESARVPDGWAMMARSTEICAGPDIWFGLITQVSEYPTFHDGATVWLVFGPSVDRAGSLREVLNIFAAGGVDLKHIRSDKVQGGHHVFFTAFACTDTPKLSSLIAELHSQSVKHRILAVIVGETVDHTPEQLMPKWDRID